MSRPFRWRRALGWAGLLLALAPAAPARQVDFDDRAGKGGPFTGPCEAAFQVDDEYAGLGVHFASGDPAVCVIAPGNAPSPPNVVAGVSGGDIDFAAPVVITFFDGATPAAVAVASLALTDSSSSTVTVEAYDVDGVLLGGSGKAGGGTHVLVFPRFIHSLRVAGGFFALDDLEFSAPGPPAEVPVLPGIALAVLAALLLGAGARALRRSPDGA